jgi:YfiR/HmsC-like
MIKVNRTRDSWNLCCCARPYVATLLAAMLAILGMASPNAANAADEQSLEYQVKAAFLLNFTKFIEWPAAAFPDDASPISICILGDDPFGKALDQVIGGEAVNARKLVIERFRRPPVPKSCDVLFISRTEKDFNNVLNGLGQGVLTVGEGESFLREGGMISFVLDNRRVRFDINQTTVEGAALKMSSKLLTVARSVRK